MAQTPDQILRMVIGDYVFQIAVLQAKVEQLTEEVAMLKVGKV